MRSSTLQSKESGNYKFEPVITNSLNDHVPHIKLGLLHFQEREAIRTNKISSTSTRSLRYIYTNYNSNSSTDRLKVAKEKKLQDKQPLKCDEVNKILSDIYDEEYDLRQLSERIKHPYSLKHLFSSNLKICQEPNTEPSNHSRKLMSNDDMTYISLWISDGNLGKLRDAIEEVLETEMQKFNETPLLDEGPTDDEQFRNNIYYLMHTLKHIDSLSDRPDISKPPGILTILFGCCILALMIAFATQPIIVIPLGFIYTVYAISLVYEQLNYKRLKGNIPVEKKIYNNLPNNFRNIFDESQLHQGSSQVEKKRL